MKLELAAGAAVKVTAVPLANAAAHVAPQEMPAGALVTVPAPVLLTVSVEGLHGDGGSDGGGGAKRDGTRAGAGAAATTPAA